MRVIEKDQLRNDVLDIVERVEGVAARKRYRCYEYARCFQDGLAGRGYTGLVVENGSVRYQAEFLRSALAPKNISVDWIEKEFAEIQTTEVLHSWLRVSNHIVDYHTHLGLTRHFGMGQVLFINSEDEIEGQVEHNKRGREIKIGGRTIVYYPPNYLTMIRT